MKNTNNIDQLIESLELENEALILVIEELVARLDEVLDPVGKEDSDVNNDGEVNRTDKYLLNRRRAIGMAIAKKKVRVSEDVETLVGIKVPKRSSRQHMVKVAKKISTLPLEQRKKHHDEAAAYFRNSNPRFNAQKFRTACGVSDGMEQSDYRTEETISEVYKTVSGEIKHLIRDKGYSRDRAVAAALSMKRKGELEEGFIKDTFANIIDFVRGKKPATSAIQHWTQQKPSGYKVDTDYYDKKGNKLNQRTMSGARTNWDNLKKKTKVIGIDTPEMKTEGKLSEERQAEHDKAAALSMKRKGELDESMKKKLGAALLAAGMAGSPAAADSTNPSETNANYNPNKTTITQPTKRNLNWRKAAAIAGAGLSTAGLVMSLKRKD